MWVRRTNEIVTEMTIPPNNHPCWTRLATRGLAGFNTNMLGLQLLFKRLELEAVTGPQKAAMIYDFFVKYGRIMSMEINQLERL